MTPQQSDKATGSKARLISVTIDLMASKGFEGTSVQDILEAAQVTKSNFYYHFKSKEDLCLAALEAMENDFFSEILEPALLHTALSPKNRLKGFFNEQLTRMETQCCKQGCPFSNLALETSDFYPEFQQRLARFYQRKARLIEACFQEGLEQGEFRSTLVPSKVSHLILAVVGGTMLLAKAYKDVEVIRQNIEIFFQLISTE